MKRTGRWGAALLLLAAAHAEAGAATGDGAEPMLALEGDRIAWRTDAAMGEPPLIVGVVRRAMAAAGDTDVRESRIGLEILSRHRPARGWALTRMGARALAAGDSARADSCWALAVRRLHPWRWQALRLRHDLLLARGGERAALAALVATDVGEIGEDVRREALWLTVRRMTATGDTAGALQRLSAGAIPVDSIGTALAWLERLERAAAQPHHALLLRNAARLWAQRATQTGRLAWIVDPLAGLAPGRDAFEAALSAADGLRRLQRYSEARALLAAVRLPRAPRAGAGPPPAGADSARADSTDRARIHYALGRIERSAGRTAAADERFEQAMRWARPDGARTAESASAAAAHGDALAARADMAIAGGDYRTARRILDDAPRGMDRRFDAAIVSLMLGDRAGAARRLAGSDAEGALFWSGVLADSRAASDSLLGRAAASPWFDFYPSMARERLRRDAPLAPPAAALPSADGTEAVRAMELMAWLGLAQELEAPLELLNDSTRENPFQLFGADWLRLARLAYGSGRPALGIRLAHKARYRPAPGGALPREAVVAWMYPPAYDSLYAASAARSGVDRALLAAIGWQESFFDEKAVSRAGALGVMQFMPATARVVAAQLGEPAPSNADLLVAGRSIRFGAHYTASLLRRFGGEIPPALAAYNAGPGRAAAWMRRANGDTGALFCEVIGFDETINYVKNIMATWQAYRRLRPHDVSAGSAAP